LIIVTEAIDSISREVVSSGACAGEGPLEVPAAVGTPGAGTLINIWTIDVDLYTMYIRIWAIDRCVYTTHSSYVDNRCI